jgi:lysozyme family protein
MRDRSPDYYSNLFASATILPGWAAAVAIAVELIWCNEEIYSGFGISPWLVGAVHCMECHCDLSRQILNGEPWRQRTVLIPAGLGPFESWRASTIEALRRRRLVNLSDVESWNGWGYAKRGVNSPYLWSGSNHGVGVGKYVEDGRYDPAAVSKQIGAAVLLKELGYTEPPIVAASNV